MTLRTDEVVSLIGRTQSRVAKTSNQLADLEYDRSSYLFEARNSVGSEYSQNCFYYAAQVGQEIKPLAIEQRVNKRLLKTLCDTRNLIGFLEGALIVPASEFRKQNIVAG